MPLDLIDTYLAGCTKACLRGTPLPDWPDDWDEAGAEAICGRIKFHGIALLLAQNPAGMRGWPASVASAVKDEARLQALWEPSHRAAIARLLNAIHEVGVRAAVMKGTAIAYGHYDDPAKRRRGDTDLLLPGARRALVRSVLKDCGFAPSGDRGPTQEPWLIATRDGFKHEVDIHWRLNGSPAVSRLLERLSCEQRFIPLDRLAPHAFALGRLDSIIMTCVNRYSHACFGYHVEDNRPADGNRLIWAVDMKLMTEGLEAGEWELLAELALSSGTAGLVADGLVFAKESIGLALPEGFLEKLSKAPINGPVAAYLGERSSLKRFRKDLAALSTLTEFLLLARLRLWPGRRFMTERFPDAEEWPLWVLRIRRLAGGVLKQFGLRD